MYFNSFFVECGEGNLVVDPLAADEALLARIERAGGVAWVVVTNRDHERTAASFKKHFGAQVAASADDAPHLAAGVDRMLEHGDTIGDARVLSFRGLKTSGEIALSFRERRAVIVGDALWGVPAGSLRLMPREKLADPVAAVLSLRALRAEVPKHVLVGDGTCVFEHGTSALQAAFERERDVFVHRVNLDELPLKRGGTGRYDVAHAEVGFLVGGERLGYRVARLDPGTVFCPLHWHSIEEELFIVWDGTPSIRTQDATWPLRAGDLVAFPTRPAGAHQVINESDEPATLILIGINDELDDCFYPDSRKALIGKRDIIVRDYPELDYYEGERL